MAALTEFSIVTPTEVKFSGRAEIVVAPGSAGDFGALAHHAPMLTTMRIGVLRATVSSGSDDAKATRRLEFAVDCGFVEVLPDKVIVLTDTALSADEIDVSKARNDQKRALEAIAQKKGADDASARRDLAWAQAQLDAAHRPA